MITAGQIALINEIWDNLNRAGQDASPSAIQKLVSPEGVVLSEYQLRAINAKVRDAYRKGLPCPANALEKSSR